VTHLRKRGMSQPLSAKVMYVALLSRLSFFVVSLQIHYIESTAATIEVVAAAGWVMAWYLTYVRVPGRGFTLVGVAGRRRVSCQAHEARKVLRTLSFFIVHPARFVQREEQAYTLI
jgi:hypothetical protein